MFSIKKKKKEDNFTYLERVYSKILKRDRNSFLYLPLASIYYHKGQIEKAITTLQNGLSVHSSYVTAKYYLAFLYRENGELDKAVEMFKKVASASKDHYGVHKALVSHYLEKKDEKNALLELKKLARIVPSDELVHDQMNKLEQKLKENDEILTPDKDDEAKTDEKEFLPEIIIHQVKEQSEEKKDTSKTSEKTVSHLENWLKNIDDIYYSTAKP
mgnify:FL=1|jgi:tetratricopeptide (TPR) repeat protein